MPQRSSSPEPEWENEDYEKEPFNWGGMIFDCIIGGILFWIARVVDRQGRQIDALAEIVMPDGFDPRRLHREEVRSEPTGDPGEAPEGESAPSTSGAD